MNKSSYKLIKVDDVLCCDNKNVYLMVSRYQNVTLPSFYICFNCNFISEVGVGIIKKGKNNKKKLKTLLEVEYGE